MLWTEAWLGRGWGMVGAWLGMVEASMLGLSLGHARSQVETRLELKKPCPNLVCPNHAPTLLLPCPVP